MRRLAVALAALVAAGALAGCGGDSALDRYRGEQENLRRVRAEQACAAYASPADRQACRQERGLD